MDRYDFESLVCPSVCSNTTYHLSVCPFVSLILNLFTESCLITSTTYVTERIYLYLKLQKSVVLFICMFACFCATTLFVCSNINRLLPEGRA